MPTLRSDRGFAMSEFLIASVITMAVIGIAVRTFDDALKINDATLKLTDAGQNMRSGVNLLVRDLLQAGRDIPTGGIPIPTGIGSALVQRPSPPGTSYAFDNTTLTTLGAVTTGNTLGSVINARQTDLITLLMGDPFLPVLDPVEPSNGSTSGPKLAANGSSMSLGSTIPAGSTAELWRNGNLLDGVGAIKTGDLLLFKNSTGSVMQTVTSVSAGTVNFAASDPFNLNQRSAENGSITDMLGSAMSVRRILMITYYVHALAATPNEPRLMRVLNNFPPQALAGVVEDLQFTYDLVDETTNPSNVDSVPFIVAGNTFTSSQIRKVNLKVGVRSEEKTRSTNDYMRHYVTTVASLRNLAYVAVYK